MRPSRFVFRFSRPESLAEEFHCSPARQPIGTSSNTIGTATFRSVFMGCLMRRIRNGSRNRRRTGPRVAVEGSIQESEAAQNPIRHVDADEIIDRDVVQRDDDRPPLVDQEEAVQLWGAGDLVLG